MFTIELFSQLVQRKPRAVAGGLYKEIIDKVIIIDYIEYDLLLDTALSTACGAIDAFYIAVTNIISIILVSADKAIVDNARKCRIEAYYIHDINDYNASYQRLMKTVV